MVTGNGYIVAFRFGQDGQTLGTITHGLDRFGFGLVVGFSVICERLFLCSARFHSNHASWFGARAGHSTFLPLPPLTSFQLLFCLFLFTHLRVAHILPPCALPPAPISSWVFLTCSACMPCSHHVSYPVYLDYTVYGVVVRHLWVGGGDILGK